MPDKSEISTLSIRSRNYGIDLLRIISMLMIVILHILIHGGLLKSSNSLNYWIVWVLEIFSFCAVNCYALISGYVGLYTKYRISNFAFIWLRVVFYTVTVTVIFKIFFPNMVGYQSIISAFFPIISKRYWYFTAYAILFLFIPILNEAINRLSKKTARFILISIVILVSVIQPFTNIIWGDVFILKNGYSAWWLIILYLIGAYIRKYGLFNRLKSHRTAVFLSTYLVLSFFTWLSKLAIQFLSNRIWGEVRYADMMVDYCSITILGAAVSLFLACEHINLRHSVIKIVAFLAPLSFSVYLIHEQSLIRSLLITDKFIWISGLPAWQIVPIILGIATTIYFVCSLIDLMRHYLFLKLRIKNRLIMFEDKLKEKF